MELNKNVGSTDKIVRYILAALFVILILTNTVSGTLAIILGVLAAIFVVTSLISFCPIWAALKFSTNKSA